MISDQNPNSYFADDENSKDLFYGYATAARRLQLQLEESHITIDKDHPLFVYLPCGVGGAPGGITYGLKTIFSEHVHCFFVEPTEAPCMLLGMSTNLHNDICVQDLGLSGTTIADGLAVGRPSKFVGTVMSKILSGIFTVTDQTMKDYLKIIFEKSNLFLEPSACASFIGVTHLYSDDFRSYLRANDINEKRMENACHIAWATGGSLIPHIEKGAYLR